MALGGLVSNRNFTCFIGPGSVYQLGKDLSPQRGGISCAFVARYGGQIAKDPFSRCWHGMCFHAKEPLNEKVSKPIPTFHDEVQHCSPLSQKSIHCMNMKLKASRRCQYFLSSDPYSSSLIQQRAVYGLGLNKLGKANTARVHYKSEEHDITEAKVDPLESTEGTGESILLEGNVPQVSSWWQQFPKRWVIVLLCFAAFLLCNMDRVNMSIAILPMSQEFNWNSATVGLIQSSFFWGYLLTQGVAMPAMNNMLSKWIPVSERSRSLALVYSGMYLGSVVGLAFSPLLIQKFGWPSVFYSFGSLGSIWFALWLRKAYSSPKDDPDLGVEEKRLILEGNVSNAPVSSIPWKLILSKAPVWALIISHFCHNWGTFILLTWMPTYYNQVLKFNLMESGLLCVLPWLTMAAFANIGGWIADTLVRKGLSITVVRKIMQSIGFLGPAFFLSQLSHVRTPAMAVLCMACSQGSDAFSQSGLYSNHQDIGPRYAGVLLGLSNTAGVLAGVFGTAATGFILQRGSWNDVFKVAVALYIIGTLVWNVFSTGEKVLD
ncbi:ascorbate transporter, chloroplastic isoform X3 [Glycine max]|uniref:Major facilitator superfamily (MFS) profile domain-containing protein n=2 Tax=Glycine max TaxID=3847 RepID=A0A0R0EG66_SOYBN|nr:ascorbate transporter, chloroplastic isoform X3 [Glycine max]|eukprot:XP_006605417.1 ascorbate transporter, chloroplastic isoform X3 [Glycine max]